MDITIHPSRISGAVAAIPSKSQAHRVIICAALADKETTIICRETNRDIEATVNCMNALGANITQTGNGYHVIPVKTAVTSAVLNCGESGSTLRFLLPVAAALGVDTTFVMEGRLPERPLSPLWEEMERMGCTLCRPSPNTVRCQGMLAAGEYTIPGNISSQYITGLLLALPLLPGDSHIHIVGNLESKPYVDLTRQTIRKFHVYSTEDFIRGNQRYHSPGYLRIECDWSNAAFFLAARELGNSIFVHDLDTDSVQGDRIINSLLPKMREHITIDTSDIPDLVPVLSIVAAAKKGAVFTNIQRLRIKESDRVASTIAMIKALGGNAEATDNTLIVYGTGLRGGIVDAANDHRIAMSAAIASTVCHENITILGAQCVQKSYPKFWEEFSRTGGHYEQYLR